MPQALHSIAYTRTTERLDRKQTPYTEREMSLRSLRQVGYEKSKIKLTLFVNRHFIIKAISLLYKLFVGSDTYI